MTDSHVLVSDIYIFMSSVFLRAAGTRRSGVGHWCSGPNPEHSRRARRRARRGRARAKGRAGRYGGSPRPHRGLAPRGSAALGAGTAAQGGAGPPGAGPAGAAVRRCGTRRRARVAEGRFEARTARRRHEGAAARPGDGERHLGRAGGLGVTGQQRRLPLRGARGRGREAGPAAGGRGARDRQRSGPRVAAGAGGSAGPGLGRERAHGEGGGSPGCSAGSPGQPGRSVGWSSRGRPLRSGGAAPRSLVPAHLPRWASHGKGTKSVRNFICSYVIPSTPGQSVVTLGGNFTKHLILELSSVRRVLRDQSLFSHTHVKMPV